MQSCDEIAELAKVCAAQARLTTSKDVASTLWLMARNYQERAGQRNGGKLPEIGDPPDLLK